MGQKYYKKRGYINEGYFGILKNAHKFQTLERRGIKKRSKRTNNKSNSTQHPKNTRKSKSNINIKLKSKITSFYMSVLGMLHVTFVYSP